MTKRFWKASILALALLVPRHASAVCGDVTGDGQKKASDALAVLKSAVGQDIALVCSDTGPSSLRYFNNFTCQSGSSVAQAKFNGFTFSAGAQQFSAYQSVDRTTINAIEITLCTQKYNFAGPLNLPPNRKLSFYMILADPDVYDFGVDVPAFFVIYDDGAPAAAVAGGDLPESAQEIAVLIGGASGAEQ